MIDLVLRASDKATIKALGQTLDLFNEDGTVKDGLAYCWWAETGKLMTAKPVFDQQGNVTTPATYMSGVVMLMRIYSLADAINEGSEQWQRSLVAKYIKDNGSYGTTAGLPYYELNGVRLFRASDVFAWLASNSLPGHEWLGGNQL